MRLKGATPAVDVRGIADPNLHSAAQTLQRLTGAQGHALTPALVRQAEAKLARGAGSREDPVLLDQLEQRLPALRKLVEAVPTTRETLPFTHTIGVDAIAHDTARKCAAALTAGTERPDVLTLDLVVEARAHLAAGAPLEGPRAQALRAAQAEGAVTPDALEALEMFLRTGQGGLVCHGPISISGQTFNDVYRLPLDGGDLRSAVDAYEVKFAHTGYDRVYLEAKPEGGLYLALNDHGRISDLVKPGYRASLPPGRERSDALEVVHVADVPNGFREATLGPWRDTVARLGDAMSGALRARATEGVERAATNAAGAVTGSPAARARVGDLVNLGTAFGGLTAIGAGVCVAELALPVVLGAGAATAIISGVNVASWARTRGSQNKTAIAHALGIAVNRPQTDII
jgi:hypothetical protein